MARRLAAAGEAEHRADVHKTFVDGAAEAGVRHLVYTSFLAAAPDATFTPGRDHFATERHIEASVPAGPWCAQLLRRRLPPVRRPGGRRAGGGAARPPGSRGSHLRAHRPRGADARRDHRLHDPGARTPLHTFDDETVEQAYASRASYGAPGWQLDAWVSTYTAIAPGELARVTGDVERLTGRPSTSIAELLAR